MEHRDAKENPEGSTKKSGISRRKWLIDVGKAAALAGIAGKTAPLDAEAAAGIPGPEKKLESLPPGLYRPSSEHLGMVLQADSRFHPIPPGCEVDFIRPRTGPYEPQFFSHDEYKVVHRLTALMLGEPAGSSAESAKPSDGNIVDEVAEWVDLRTDSFSGVRDAAGRLTAEQVAVAKAYNGAPLLRRVKTTDPQKTYRDGLAWLAGESERRHQRGFVNLNEQQQAAILDLISDERAGKGGENDGTRLFRQIKDDMISGFYTSRTGLKELDDQANRFHAESPGCPSSATHRPKPNR
ncbi:MAG TPA: gluconate 2-dehydrogenase subunit 3 family protein [Terriglobia bacterium]|nr:gluconate 2-dehydrogenase subunit 3 family protein [Terriglobia bacterium]